MKTIVITKTLSDGTIKISSRPLPPKTSVTDLVSYLNYQMSIGLLCSYEIEIIRGDNR